MEVKIVLPEGKHEYAPKKVLLTITNMKFLFLFDVILIWSML